MPSRRCCALIVALCGGINPAAGASLDYIGTYVWSRTESDFGGFSGIDLSQDGSEITVLSDRATIWWGQVERDDFGVMSGIALSGKATLRDSQGKMLVPGYLGDSEGLAIAPDGRIWVSFEGLNRIAVYDDLDGPAERIPSPPEFKDLLPNAALESLAVTEDGTILTWPERSGRLTLDFPVWRYRDGLWDQPFAIPRSGNWLAVGGDIGPDGKLYMLERDFHGLLGFRSRVRRFTLTETGVSDEETLLESRMLQYDNLEGIAVWQDDLGIRFTMVSDDNFNFIQRTELVEYRVRD